MRIDLLPDTKEGKLAHLIEECGEVIQMVGKLYRFGDLAQDPETGIVYHNQRDLFEEIIHLREAIDRYLMAHSHIIAKISYE